MIIISPLVLFDLDKTVEIYPSMIVVKASMQKNGRVIGLLIAVLKNQVGGTPHLSILFLSQFNDRYFGPDAQASREGQETETTVNI
jgi:hypothetical protein